MTREKEIYRVTLVGSIGNALLVIFKFVAGILGHSSAMIADAVHSLSDFITDIIVIIFVGISVKPQDESHDYGHGKFETLASFFVALALLGAAGGIIVSGCSKLLDWWKGIPLEAPGILALWAALISIAVKELLYQYTAKKGKTLQSQVMIANAWHHRSDALSSIGAAVGIGGAIWLGDQWTVLDPLASVVVGLMLVKVAYDLLKINIGELTECSLSAETEQDIIQIIEAEPGVSEPHHLRTRRIGNRIAIDTHIRLDGDMSLCEAHHKATAIENSLKARFGEQTHVTIHMEPVKKK